LGIFLWFEAFADLDPQMQLTFDKSGSCCNLLGDFSVPLPGFWELPEIP
jgi:hypothetical protein